MERSCRGITGEAFVTGVQLLDTQTKEERFVAADGIFIAVGIQPVSESFKSLVKRTRQAISVRERTAARACRAFLQSGTCGRKSCVRS